MKSNNTHIYQIISEQPLTNVNVMFGDLFSQRADYSNGLFYSGHRKFLNPEEKSSFEPPPEFKSKRHNLRNAHKNDPKNGAEVNFHINFQKKQDAVEEMSEHHKKFKKVATLIKTTVILEHFSSMSRNDWVEDLQAGCRIWINKNTGEVVTVCPWQQQETHTPPEANSLVNTARDSVASQSSHGTLSHQNTHSSISHLSKLSHAGSHSGFSQSGLAVLNSHKSASHSLKSHHLDQNSSIFDHSSLGSLREEDQEFGTGSLVYDSTELECLFDTLDRMKK